MPDNAEDCEPPTKFLTLPFVPPTFNWNASNLYAQFKLFIAKVEFAFKVLMPKTMVMPKWVPY